LKIESGQRREFRYDTPNWSHFGFGEGWEFGRCNRCLDHVSSTKTAGPDAVNCWKVLVFADAVTNFDEVTRYLVERAEEEKEIVGKWQRGRGVLAVVYATSEIRRDELKTSIYHDLKKRGLLKKSFLPYRRGCRQFERYLGPWRSWEAGKGVGPSLQDSLEASDMSEE